MIVTSKNPAKDLKSRMHFHANKCIIVRDHSKKLIKNKTSERWGKIKCLVPQKNWEIFKRNLGALKTKYNIKNWIKPHTLADTGADGGSEKYKWEWKKLGRKVGVNDYFNFPSHKLVSPGLLVSLWHSWQTEACHWVSMVLFNTANCLSQYP